MSVFFQSRRNSGMEGPSSQQFLEYVIMPWDDRTEILYSEVCNLPEKEKIKKD